MLKHLKHENNLELFVEMNELRIAMREIESDDPEVMYEHAKNVSKKYFGKSAVTGK